MLSSLKNKWKLVASVLGVIIIAAAGWYYFSLGKTNTTQAVASEQVKRGEIKVTVSATGTVEPLSTRKVLPKTSATITEIHYVDGQAVNQGQLLAKLDSSSVEGEIAKAEADLRLAELDYSTTSKQLGEDLSNQVVTSPISGKVALLDTANGAAAQKNGVLMIIEDQSKALAKALYTQTEVKNIRVGQSATVLVADQNTSLSGRVLKVDQDGTTTEDGSRAFEVTVQVPTQANLSAGMGATVTVHTPQGGITSASTAYLEWNNAVAVRAGINGTIRNLTVGENATVKAGQRLATIDLGTVSSDEQTKNIKVQQARVTLETLRKKLADYSVYAISSGQLNLDATQKLIQVGDEATPGQALASITSHQEMTVTVPVDEVDIAKVKVGQKADITVDALPDNKFSGKVINVASQGTEANNVANFDVTVQVDKPEGLKAMMTANVEILVAQKADALLVPIEAVQEFQGKQFVIPATAGAQQPNNKGAQGSTTAGQNRRSRMKEVQTGLYNETYMEITSGLQEGDLVTIPSSAKSNTSGFRFPGMGGGDRGPGGSDNHPGSTNSNSSNKSNSSSRTGA